MDTKVTVMVIDDEIHMRRLITRMLEGAGFGVIEVPNGKLALQLLEVEPKPAVITCDISMPDMDGFEILEAIKSNSQLAHIPVVMLTAMGQISEAARAKKMGASDYITKPFSAMSLIDILHKHAHKV